MIAERIRAALNEEVVFAVIGQLGDVVKGVGIFFRQVEVLCSVRRKARDAGTHPVSTRGLWAELVGSIGSAEITAGLPAVQYVEDGYGRSTVARDHRIQLTIGKNGIKQLPGQREPILLIRQPEFAQSAERE